MNTIIKYMAFQKIGLLSKPQSNSSILICTNDPDADLIDVVTFYKHSHIIIHDPAINDTQLNEFIERYKKSGYKLLLRTKQRVQSVQKLVTKINQS